MTSRMARQRTPSSSGMRDAGMDLLPDIGPSSDRAGYDTGRGCAPEAHYGRTISHECYCFIYQFAGKSQLERRLILQAPGRRLAPPVTEVRRPATVFLGCGSGSVLLKAVKPHGGGRMR